jgi:hypothetical protein
MNRWLALPALVLMIGCGSSSTEPSGGVRPGEVRRIVPEVRERAERDERIPREGYECVKSAAISRDNRLALTVYKQEKGAVAEPRSLAL